MFSFMAQTFQAIFIRILRVLNTFQFSRFVLSFLATARLIYHSFSRLSTTFFIFFRTFSVPAVLTTVPDFVLSPVSQGRVLSYHLFRQMSTPFFVIFYLFLNCFNSLHNNNNIEWSPVSKDTRCTTLSLLLCIFCSGTPCTSSCDQCRYGQ